MATVRSAAQVCGAPRSGSENTATVSTPSSRHARMMRSATSPRFAISKRRIMTRIPRPRRFSLSGARGRDRRTIFYFGSHASQIRIESKPKLLPVPPAAHAANERARVIERQRGNVGAEITPDTVLPEILFHIRQVKRRHGRPPFLQVSADRSNRLGTREIAHHRHEQVPGLQVFQEREGFFGGK